jgi:hypothetical protein
MTACIRRSLAAMPDGLQGIRGFSPVLSCERVYGYYW